MNSPNLTPGERDLEALRRAQRAHEPSMEEILASIRSIIADDREPPVKPAPAPSGPQCTTDLFLVCDQPRWVRYRPGR